MQGYTKAFS